MEKIIEAIPVYKCKRCGEWYRSSPIVIPHELISYIVALYNFIEENNKNIPEPHCCHLSNSDETFGLYELVGFDINR